MDHYDDLDNEKKNTFEQQRESVLYQIKEGMVEADYLEEEGNRLDKKQKEISDKL
jgi:hypothetical protein